MGLEILKGEDIKKISETKGIVSTIKRINGIGDLLDYEIIETEQRYKISRQNVLKILSLP